MMIVCYAFVTWAHVYNSTIKNFLPHSSLEDLFFESLDVLPDVLHHGQHQVEGPAFTWS